ncbi:MAG: hypothetical protein HUJ68_01470 [Clostridia bacterium]|nr:hypothetical protein [Clostridia bacterium]
MQNLKDLVEVFGISQVCINHTIKKPNFSNNKIKSFFENFGLKDKVYITYDLLDEEAKRVFLSIKE